MNILLINHYAGSPGHGMEYRPFYLAREWVRAGHRVQIVAASFSHVRSRQPEVGEAALDETIDGVAYRWLPTPAYASNGIGRVRNIFSFLRQLWRLAPAALITKAPSMPKSRGCDPLWMKPTFGTKMYPS